MIRSLKVFQRWIKQLIKNNEYKYFSSDPTVHVSDTRDDDSSTVARKKNLYY
jgi:hypothetical protein